MKKTSRQEVVFQPLYVATGASTQTTHADLLQPLVATPQMTSPAVASSATYAASNRMSYPREFKLLVIDYYRNQSRNKYRTCKRFHITKSMLNGWIAKFDSIMHSRPGALKSGRSGRRPQFANVEQRLFDAYLDKCRAGEKVSNRWLRDTAKELADQQSEQPKATHFSERWLANFKKRFSIQNGTESPDEASSLSGQPDEEHQFKPLHLDEENIQYSCIERQLVDSIGTHVQLGLEVTHTFLEAQCTRLAQNLCPNDVRAQKVFVEHWLHNFKRRNRLSNGRASSQQALCQQANVTSLWPGKRRNQHNPQG